MKKQTSLLTAGLMLIATAMAGGDQQPVAPPKPKPVTQTKPVTCQSIAKLVASDPQFSTLLTAVKSADLVSTLDGQGNYTVFAPNNAAFQKVPSDKLANLLNDKKALRNVLLYHVVNDVANFEVIKTFNSGTTMQGGDMAIKAVNKKVMINDANIIKPDIKACNGIVHVIDNVLMPPQQKPEGKVELTKPKPAAKPAPAKAPTTSTTVTSPQPKPEAKKVEEIKEVKEEVVVKDTEVKEVEEIKPATGAKTENVTAKDIKSKTETTVENKAAETKASAQSDQSTIMVKDMSGMSTVDLVAKEKRFSTLLDLIKKAGLADTLNKGEYTVFAPTNDAFSVLPDSALTALANDPKALTNLLKGHVVKGKVNSEQIAKQESLKSIQDSELPLFNNYPTAGYKTKTGMVYEVADVLFASNFEMPNF